MEDYESNFDGCPACGHEETRSTHCSDCLGEGFFDESDEDFCEPGTILVDCPECKGSGRIHWCPKCGVDIYHDHDSE